MRNNLSNKGSIALLATGNRFKIILDNYKRTDSLMVRLRGTLTVAGAAAGLVRGGGWLSNVVQHAIAESGNDVWGLVRARNVRQAAEWAAGQPLGGTSLPASAALPIGVYALDEFYEVNFSDRRLVVPTETAFKEALPDSFLTFDTIVLPNAINSLVAPAGGSTVTLTNLSVEVVQNAIDQAGVTNPVLRPRVREFTLPVSGISPALLFYIKTQERIGKLILSAEATNAVDGGTFPVSDVITALRLIGDAPGGNIIGPNQTSYPILVNEQRNNAGGDVTRINGAFLVSDFAEFGRLSKTLVPEVELPNFRYELAVAPSASGSSELVVAMWELTRPSPVNGYPVVSAELPGWL